MRHSPKSVIFFTVVVFLFAAAEHMRPLGAQSDTGLNGAAQNDDWRSSLHHAAYTNDVSRMRELINKGADVNEVIGEYARPLHYAVCKGHLAATELLLASGADINGRDDQGNTVLMHAVRAGQREMVAFLINKGADASLNNDNNETPLMSVCGINSNTARWMAEQDKVADKEPDLLAIATMLLKQNVYVNARTNREHNTALLLASFEGYSGLVDLLLKAGAEVNVSTEVDKLTPLMQAARENHPSIVSALLKAGADTNTRDRLGRTAFDWAQPFPDVVKTIKAAGGRSGESKTATAPEQKEHKQLKPAAEVPEIVSMLKSMGYQYTEEYFFHAVQEGKVQAVELFLQAGISVNIQRTSPSGTNTPLCLSVLGCAQGPGPSILEMVQTLIEYGADVNIADMNGSTPLIWAVQTGCQVEVIKTLIGAGADVNARAAGGATPLMMAEVFKREEIVKLLKNSGAKINVKKTWRAER